MLKELPNWITWKPEKRGGKVTKIPYTVSGSPASSTDPKTWTTYKEVKKVSKNIGFVLPLDGSILAVDIDKCLTDKKIKSEMFASFVTNSNTYTEISPSGTGLHLFFVLSEKFDLEAHRSSKCPGFECYTKGRYMTVTENLFNDSPKKIRVINKEEALSLLSSVGYPWKVVNQKVRQPTIMTLSNEEIKNRMFSSKKGDKIRKLWDGDTSEYNNDQSAADMALCVHLAFWSQKNIEVMRSLWLSSPLGSREKTTNRKDYQDITLSHAIAFTSDIYSPTGEEVVKSLNLMTNKKGVPFKNAENIKRLIGKDELLCTSFRFNDFSHEIETNLNSPKWRQLETQDIIFVMIHIQKNYVFFEITSKDMVEDAITAFSIENRVNPPVDMIDKLEWDGEHRLDHWLSIVYGTQDDEYHSSVGANWMKGLVKRIIQPGCKFDFLMILEGPQGWMKSTSLAVIGRGYHVETVITPENKDFFMLMLQNSVVEFSEGHTMNRSDTRLLKSVITMQDDQFRPPYGRGIIKFPRHCVFAMTTNQNTYLRDETGNRRFLPVELTKPADIQWLKDNIEQMYAEAYKRAIVDNETIWEFPEVTKDIQESKMIENPYEDSLLEWYSKLSIEKRNNGITSLEAYSAVWLGNVSLGREMNMMQSMIVTSLFKNSLFLNKRRCMTGGLRTIRWYPSEKTNEQVPAAEIMFANSVLDQL